MEEDDDKKGGPGKAHDDGENGPTHSVLVGAPLEIEDGQDAYEKGEWSRNDEEGE